VSGTPSDAPPLRESLQAVSKVGDPARPEIAPTIRPLADRTTRAQNIVDMI
jgi:hypothetical protein